MFQFLRIAVGVVALALTNVGAWASCGASFCSVMSDQSIQEPAQGAGWRADLRYEYVDQDQPRTHSRSVAVGEVHRHHDEVRTLGRNLNATLDYNSASNWGVSVSVPYLNRDHDHIHNHHGEQIPESWQISEPGDIRAIGRYRLALDQAGASAGLLLGVKLGTGSIHVKNADGDEAERSLQPGTGSTDVIFGAYYGDQLTADTRWFVQAKGQNPMLIRAGYRPGAQANLDTGVRSKLSSQFEAMLQLNLQYKWRDKGVNGEPADSGGRAAFLSPGLSWSASRDTSIYAYVQLPVYQYVNGVQLSMDRAAVVGASYRF